MPLLLSLLIGISFFISLTQPLRSRRSIAFALVSLLIFLLSVYYSSAAPYANDNLAYRDVFNGFDNPSLDPLFVSLLQYLHSISFPFNVILFLSPFSFLTSLFLFSYLLLPHLGVRFSSFSFSSRFYILFLTVPLFYTSLRQENLFYLMRENFALTAVFLSLSVLISRKLLLPFRIVIATAILYLSFSFHQLVVSIFLFFILASIVLVYIFKGFNLRVTSSLFLNYHFGPRHILILLLPIAFIAFLFAIPYILQCQCSLLFSLR